MVKTKLNYCKNWDTILIQARDESLRALPKSESKYWDLKVKIPAEQFTRQERIEFKNACEKAGFRCKYEGTSYYGRGMHTPSKLLIYPSQLGNKGQVDTMINVLRQCGINASDDWSRF